MKNTGIIYPSTERKPAVLPELAQLLPPLTEEQSSVLEADLLANGCYSPLIVNQDMVIVDGHNRQSICERHNIPYQMAVFEFADLLEAKQWALNTQKGRRNLDKWELGKIALKLKPELSAKAKANQSAAGGDKSKGAHLEKIPQALPHINTREEMAKSVGISDRTMGMVMKIDENAPQVIKDALNRKEISVNQGYTITRQVMEVPEEERDRQAAIAVEVAKARDYLRKKDVEIDQAHKIANAFSLAYEKAIVLTPTEENVRMWIRNSRMTPGEIWDTIKDSQELAETFITIKGILEKIIAEQGGKQDYWV